MGIPGIPGIIGGILMGTADAGVSFLVLFDGPPSKKKYFDSDFLKGRIG
jgi:hypothetical protein